MPIDVVVPAAPVVTALTIVRPLVPTERLTAAESPAAGPGDTVTRSAFSLYCSAPTLVESSVGDVVPHPAHAERRFFDAVVVADDAAVDRADAALLQPARPVGEHAIGHAVRPQPGSDRRCR